MHHELKITPEFFDLVNEDKKTFECRLNDRNFAINDILFLMEWSPGTGYTGRKCYKKIKYILEGGRFGIFEDHVCLAICKALRMKCATCNGYGQIIEPMTRQKVFCTVCEGLGTFYY